jgi:hypothetical protein
MVPKLRSLIQGREYVRPTERLLVILGVAMMVFGGGGDVRADDHEA